MKELPTGLQVFENIRKEDGLYVDKTGMIYNIVSKVEKYFFISRPRRFDKSLLCWTLDALFSGKRELFEGLAISKTDWEWESYPVIHLNMGKVNTSDGLAGIDNSLKCQTNGIARKYGIDLGKVTIPGLMLGRTISEVSRKYSKPVVVIIDEYDTPFLNFYDKPSIAQQVRDIMGSYYAQLKGNEQHIRFLFMTGISKMTSGGIFDRLNNLNDLSMDEEYGALLGYTEKELVDYFGEYLDAGAKELNLSVEELVDKLRSYYYGFCFDGVTRVYNPFTVLNFFENYTFLSHWIHSGSSRVIADYMKDRRLTAEQFRGLQVSWDFVRRPGEIETASPQSFLYQAGYLTLREGVSGDFSLDYPNTEVLNSMSELVYKNMLQSSGYQYFNLDAPILHALFHGDCKCLINTINNLLAGIPYDDYTSAARQALEHTGANISIQEWLYRSTILALLRSCNVVTFGEMYSNNGRSDLLLMHKGRAWVLEIKVAHNDDCAAVAQEAMKQINDNQYADPYKNAKKVAIAIDDKTRQIGEWIVA